MPASGTETLRWLSGMWRDPYRHGGGVGQQLIALTISLLALAVFIQVLVALLTRWMPWMLLGLAAVVAVRWLLNRRRYF